MYSKFVLELCLAIYIKMCFNWHVTHTIILSSENLLKNKKTIEELIISVKERQIYVEETRVRMEFSGHPDLNCHVMVTTSIVDINFLFLQINFYCILPY